MDNDHQFSPLMLNDIAEANDNACDVINAIEALQTTYMWMALPHKAKVALCAAHAHATAMNKLLDRYV